MNNAKRYLPILVLTALVVGLAACTDDGPEPAGTAVVESAVPESTAPDTTGPAESTAPDTTPDTTAPETTMPDTSPGSTSPDSTAPGSSAPGECADEPTVETATDLVVGLTEDEAEEALEECGWTMRVGRRDGEDLAMTMDFRPERVNVEVTDGEVTEVLSIG
jgi:hypothetical protein